MSTLLRECYLQNLNTIPGKFLESILKKSCNFVAEYCPLVLRNTLHENINFVSQMAPHLRVKMLHVCHKIVNAKIQRQYTYKML